jgi:hypothetical protein
MIKLNIPKRPWMGLVTLGIIAALFAYYLLIYTEDRKEKFIERRYRILTRMGDNTYKLKEDIKKAVDREWKGVQGRLDHVLDEYYDLMNHGTDQELLNKKVMKVYEEYRSGKIKHGLRDFILRLQDKDFWNTRCKYPDTIYFKTNYAPSFSGSFDTRRISSFHTNISTLLARLGASQEIGDYFVIRSFLNEEDTVNVIGYQTFKNKIRLTNFDSLMRHNHGLQTGTTEITRIREEDYIILPHRIHFESDEDWIICMVIKVEDLNSYARKIELWIIVYALLFGLFILIAMPVLKLILMSPYERLRTSNVWFTGFSVCIGSSVVALILLGLYHYFGHYHQIDGKLLRLANAVNTKFSSELDGLYAQLNQVYRLEDAPWKNQPVKLGYVSNMDSLIIKIKEADSLTQEFRRTKSSTGNSEKTSKLDTAFFQKLLSKRYFNQIIWIDNKGDQLVVLATHNTSLKEESLNLSQRKYFSSVMKDELWALPSSQVPTGQFALQSIRSWRSSKEEVGFTIAVQDTVQTQSDSSGSKKSTRKVANVLLIATKLYSVMDAVVPPGYGFCIIDKMGEVQFHSETDRNLQENFLEETNDSQLEAAVLGRLTIETDAMYYDKKVRTHIQPIKNTELSLITYYDLEYYKSPLVLTLGYAVALILFLFTIQGLQHLLLFLTTYRPTLLNVRRFYLNWMRPIPDRAIDGDKSRYYHSVKTQFFLVIFMSLLVSLNRERWLTFCFIILPVFLLLYHFIVLRGGTLLAPDPNKKMRRHPFVIISFLLIIVCNLFAYPYMESIVAALGVQVVIGLLLLYTARIKIPAIERLVNRIIQMPFPRPYMACMFFWLLLTTAMPVVYFYKCGYYEELQAWNRYLQLESAKCIVAREKEVVSEVDSAFMKLDREELQEIFFLGDYIESTGEVSHSSITKCYYRISSGAYFDLLFKIAPITNELLEKGKSSIYPTAGDRQWLWLTDRKATVMLNYRPVVLDSGEERPSYSLATTIPDFTFSNSDYQLIFLLSLIVVCYLMYRILKFATFQIFGLELLQVKEKIQTKEEISDTIIKSIDHGDSQILFIIGLPNSGKSWIIDKVREGRENVVDVVNFRDDVLDFNEDKSVIFLQHFESGINNHKLNAKKLKFLNKILDDHAKSLIVLSSVQPQVVLEFYDKKIKDIRQLPPDNANRKETQEYKQAIRLWKNLLREFRNLYMSLQDNCDPHLSFLHRELLLGSFLPKLMSKFENRDLSSYEGREEVILQIQEMAESYYRGVWNSFSTMEKLMLYDLAKDCFVNTRNLSVLRVLMLKGAITCYDSIRVMNQSFNDFILRTVKEDEEVAMEKLMKQKGTWNSIQMILVLVFIAIAVFISLSEQQLMQNFNALITAIGGATALILRFGGVFGAKDAKGG